MRGTVPDELWTVEQVAAYLKVTERTIRDWRDRDATFSLPLGLPGRALAVELHGVTFECTQILRSSSWMRGTGGGAARFLQGARSSGRSRDPDVTRAR